jgi:flagellar biosynthetic protein FliO
MRFSAACLFLIIIISTVSWSQTPKMGTGDFDIGKVREAIFDQQDTNVNADPVQTAKSPESYTLVIVRIIMYLAIVIAIIFAVAWIARKSGLTGTSRIGGGGAMDVLEVLPFGQNRNAILVRVMDSVYLLGQTPNSIVLLEKIEGQKAIDLISTSKGGSSVTQFKDAFNNFLGKIKKPV